MHGFSVLEAKRPDRDLVGRGPLRDGRAEWAPHEERLVLELERMPLGEAAERAVEGGNSNGENTVAADAGTRRNPSEQLVCDPLTGRRKRKLAAPAHGGISNHAPGFFGDEVVLPEREARRLPLAP